MIVKGKYNCIRSYTKVRSRDWSCLCTDTYVPNTHYFWRHLLMIIFIGWGNIWKLLTLLRARVEIIKNVLVSGNWLTMATLVLIFFWDWIYSLLWLGAVRIIEFYFFYFTDTLFTLSISCHLAVCIILSVSILDQFDYCLEWRVLSIICMITDCAIHPVRW